MSVSLHSSSPASDVIGLAGEYSKYSLDWYQLEALATLERLRGFAGLFMEMGTGKTRTSLAHLHRRAIKRVVVICTLDGMGAWELELGKMGLNRQYSFNRQDGDFGWDVLALDDDYSLRERADLLKRWGRDYVFVLVNHEVFWREPVRSAILKFNPEAVIIDEAHKINHRNSKQSRFAHTLGDRPLLSRMALTGSPVTNGIENFFSLYRFINPSVFGRRWGDFEMQHIIYGGWQNRQITGYRDSDIVWQKVGAASYAIAKDVAVDLPPKQDIVVKIPLSDIANVAYKAMKKNSLAKINGLGPDGRPLQGNAIARIALTTILRLQQITSGFCTTLNGDIDISDEKLTMTHMLVRRALMNGEKVVVFCRFRRDVERVGNILTGFRTGKLMGGMSRRKRQEVINKLHFGGVDVVIAQIDTASLSIDLTPASVGIFYSTGYAYAPFIQAKDRLHRRGQKKRVLYFYLVADKTVDEKTLSILQNKQSVGQYVMNNPHSIQSLI